MRTGTACLLALFSPLVKSSSDTSRISGRCIVCTSQDKITCFLRAKHVYDIARGGRHDECPSDGVEMGVLELI